ncbi:MAG TPA: hypothetical protein VF230_05560 [Acidimicrobiales bacterium]
MGKHTARWFGVAAIVLTFAACDADDDGEANVASTGSSAGDTTTTTTTEDDGAAAPAQVTTTGQGYRGTAPVTAKPKPPAPTTTQAAMANASSSGVANADRLVEFAKEDLVRRFGHDKSDIRLLDMESVTWPNAALGCPRYGKEYDDADVPGYRIELQWKDVEYSYHGRDGSDPFLCEKLD